MPKKRTRKKTADYKTLILVIIIMLFAVYTFLNDNGTTTAWTNTVNNLTTNNVTNEDLKIYFIDVGQADCSLIINDNKTMLIDAGNNEDGKLIVNFIKSLGISKIDYLVGTHAHEDHIGGLDNIIKSFDIGTVYFPYTSEKTTTTKTFEDVVDGLVAKGLSITSSKIGDKFSLGEANCEIMYIDNSEPEDTNDQSICIRVTFGEQSYLFMGDASSKVEKTRSWPKTSVLKVGHHGSSQSTSKEFLKQVEPEIAIISVGKDNSYGHPHETLLKRLKSTNAKIYRTDKLGTILLTSDGKTNTITNFKTNTNGN